MNSIVEQRRIGAYLDSIQARLAWLPLATFGDFVRELQSTAGEESRPFFGRTLLPSVLDRAFKGEL
jgi:hypothetical protein